MYEDKISSSLRDLPTRAHSIISINISKNNLNVRYSHVILDHRIMYMVILPLLLKMSLKSVFVYTLKDIAKINIDEKIYIFQ